MTTWWTKCWIVFAVTLPAAVLAAEPGEFDKLRADYEAGRTNCHAAYQAEVAKIRESYAKSLDALGESLQRQGNLDALLAVKAEQKRVQEQGVAVCLEQPASLPALAPVQKSHRVMWDQAGRLCAAQLANLQSNYAARLKALVVALTKDNRLDEAVKAKAELESLAQKPAILPTPALPAELAKSAVLLMSFDRETVIPGRNDEAQVKDLSGRGNHGQLKGATLVPGIIGTALAFNGPSDIATIPHSESLNLSKDITLAAWIRGRDNQQDEWPRIIHKFMFTKQQGWEMAVARHNSNAFFDGFPVGQYRPIGVSSERSVLDGQWHHVAGMFDGQRLQFYVDGLARGHRALNSRLAPTTDKELTIGNGFDGNVWHPFIGAIDEVAVFNRALGADEIKRLYELGKPALVDKPAAPPVKRFVAKIKADRGWQPAGMVTAGQTVEITAEGRWTFGRSLSCDANGNSWWINNGGPLLVGRSVGLLIGRIGDKMFPVGAATQLVADRTGRLELRINDGDDGQQDNAGELTVTITTR